MPQEAQASGEKPDTRLFEAATEKAGKFRQGRKRHRKRKRNKRGGSKNQTPDFLPEVKNQTPDFLPDFLRPQLEGWAKQARGHKKHRKRKRNKTGTSFTTAAAGQKPDTRLFEAEVGEADKNQKPKTRTKNQTPDYLPDFLVPDFLVGEADKNQRQKLDARLLAPDFLRLFLRPPVQMQAR